MTGLAPPGTALARTPLAAGVVDRALAQQGARLAAVGNAQRGVQACANCHGPNGSGVPPDVPRLAGQSANYIAAQVPALNNGQRKNDPLAMMRDVATRLTPEDMQAVAQCQAAQDGDIRMAGR
jgi:cytochrome c553